MELSQVETVDRVPVLRVRGDVDLETCAELRDALDGTIARGAALIVVDIAGVTFFDSSGLKVLDDARRNAEQRGAAVALVCPHERLLRLFDITGLADRFAIEPTTELAVTSARPRPDSG